MNAEPSQDPSDDGSLVGSLRLAFKKFMQQTDDMLPAQVVAFDRATGYVSVRPCIAVVTTDDRIVARAPLAKVPVMQLGGGGALLSFNLEPGDLGFIKANDRDISHFLQAFGAASPPNTARLHSFQDGVFVPSVLRGWTIAGDDAEAAVLQTLDGSTKLAIGAGRAVLASGGNSVTVTPAGTTIVGQLTINGVVFGTHRHAPLTSGPTNP